MSNSGNDGALNEWPGFAFALPPLADEPVALEPGRPARRSSIQVRPASAFAVGRTYVLPLARDSVLPRIPPGGFRTEAEIAALPGVEVLPYGDLVLGPSPSVYAFSRVTTTRNLYRIPLQ